MKKHILGLILFLPLVSALAACQSVEDVPTLRILNSEDYIYDDEESGESLVSMFQDYIEAEKGYRPKVVYDTFDTNESMLNELKTGKVKYDLVVTSDYTIQKMMVEDMILPFDDALIPNYTEYASPYLKDVFENIIAYKHNDATQPLKVSDYAKGYMWGTLGMLFNPELLENEERSFDRIISDFQSWDVLWNKDYKGTFSIKDSMRDTYAAGILYVYQDELTALRADFLDGKISVDQYNETLTEYFNRTDEATIEKVKDALFDLKDNAFGFEVDSGKEDIKTRKIGANLAWSGDAVYAMDGAEEMANSSELYYAIPENGANIWFDAFVMLKGANSELAHAFVDFVSDPENAALNMDYIGYTPFIGGDAIIDVVRDWYDVRTEISEADDIEFDDIDMINDFATYEEGYGPIETIDLSYFFSGTLSEEYENNGASTFYSTTYLPFKEETGNISVGRQFFCQYPDQDMINRGAIMNDFGDRYDAVLEMWLDVRATYLPVWALVLLIVEIALILFLALYFFFKKRLKKKLRKNRKAHQN